MPELSRVSAFIRIDLTEVDLAECKRKGEETVAICRQQGARPRLKEGTEKMRREQGNEMGFRGELAFAKLFKLKPTEVTVTADDGIDYILDDGRTVDVKLSTYSNGDLIFDSFARFKSDIAVLAYGRYTDPYVDIAGWITKEDFKSKCTDKNYGYGNRKALLVQDLNSMDTLGEIRDAG
tara:strand:- start:1626 stop:2162 length:537 start_codon:yes stop_codon:yes gene_type:complete